MLAGLAIYRQIRDFGLLFGDGKFELAIYRQSPKFRDLSLKDWRFWRILENSCNFGEIQTKKGKIQGTVESVQQNPTKKDHFSGHFLLNFEQL